MSGRKPDYTLKVGLAESKYHKRIGAAWKLDKGDGIAIKIDPGVALVGAADVRITLWPADDEKKNENQWG